MIAFSLFVASSSLFVIFRQRKTLSAQQTQTSLNIINIRSANIDDKSSIVGMTIAMASETEDVRLPIEGVERGVGTAFSRREYQDDELRLKYWVATSSKATNSKDTSSKDTKNTNSKYTNSTTENIVGVIGVSPEYSDWWGTQYWWIVSLYTKPSFRKQGIASKLLQHVKKISHKHKVQSLSLRVEKQNLAAQALYKKNGFVLDTSHYVMTVGRTPSGKQIF